MYIYKTTNKVNGKIYVGMSQYKPDDNPEYLGSGRLLKKAIAKYGEQSFEKEVLEECESESQMRIRERFWIKKLKSRERGIGYNISEGGDWGDTWSKHPERDRLVAECSQRVSGEGNPNFGNRWSDEQRKKASQQAKKDQRCIDKKTGLNRFQLPESRKKISEVKTGINNPNAVVWEVISPDGKSYWIAGGIKREIKKLGFGLDYQQFREYRTEKVAGKKTRRNKTGWTLINHGKHFEIPSSRNET